MDGLAVAVGEHPPGGLDADSRVFGVLPLAPTVDDTEGGGVKIDAASCVAGLAAGLVYVVADGDEASVD
jgi:hypothetical protein